MGSAQDASDFPCSLSAMYLILPASSFFCSAFHGIHVPQWMLGASCRTCCVASASRSASTRYRVWVTFPNPVRIKFAPLQSLARVPIPHPSLPKQETEAEPCHHTWPVYEVTIPWLRRGIWLPVCVSLRQLQHTIKWVCLNCFTVQLHHVLAARVYCEDNCLTEQLHRFPPFCRRFSISLRIRALKQVRVEGRFIFGSLFSVFLRLQKSTHVELAFSEQGECNPAGSAIILFI